MKSLFTKILLWFWCTGAITLVGTAFISALNVNRNASDEGAPAARLVRLELEAAREAYEDGGRPRLAAFIDTIDRIYGAKAILTDERGLDLLNNHDRSDLIRRASERPSLTIRLGRTTVARAADDGRYWFFLIVQQSRIGWWFLTPDHLLFFMAAAVLPCYWFARYLTNPVRELQKAVEKFGRGDLTTRADNTRGDELGDLARTFNRMAARIETLLAAERRLLMDISHELRSPLARLGVAVELARSGDALESNLNRIQKESERLNALVGQLLQVTRAEGDPNSLRREPLRLDELVAQLVEDARIEAEAHGCKLEYAAREPLTVEGDAELLRRAVENVIRNAIRYAPRDTAVEVSVARRAQQAVLEVRDYGPGVPEESLPRLFDPFYRVDSDRNRTSGGNGLGLSIARRAIQLQKGSIQARNRNPGLEIKMELPAV